MENEYENGEMSDITNKPKGDHSKNLMVDPPITVGETRVLAVSNVFQSTVSSGNVCLFTAGKSPEAIVIITPKGQHAYDINGKEIPIEDLLRRAPDIAQMITE